MSFRPASALLIVTAALAGCDVFGPVSQFAEACEHLTAEPAALLATASAASAPAVATHTRYEVALPEVSGARTGLVKFAATLRGSLLLFLAADVPVRIATASGQNVPFTDSGKGGPCPELTAWYEAEVGVGQQLITLGGPDNTVATVGLVLETDAGAP
jgi:hypothetical protein